MTEARYANSKVYKLVDDDGYYYYGRSCLPLHKRYYKHKIDSKLDSNRKLYGVFTLLKDFVMVTLKLFLWKNSN